MLSKLISYKIVKIDELYGIQRVFMRLLPWGAWDYSDRCFSLWTISTENGWTLRHKDIAIDTLRVLIKKYKQ